MRRVGLLVFLFLLLCFSQGTSAAEQVTPDTMAVVGGYLIDGNEGEPIRDSVILIEGNRIIHVGTVANTEIPEGAEVVDANGYTVMPGLHDVHVHLQLTGHGVYSEYYPRYRDQMREIMPITARQLLMSGVTSAREVGANLKNSIWLKNEIEAGRLPGPRLFVSGPFLQKNAPAYGSFYRKEINGEEDARAEARRLIDAGVDLLKVIQLSQMTTEERMAIAEEAEKAGLHIAVHAWDLEEHRMAVKMGARTIEHIGAGSKPQFREESIRLLADNNIYYVPTNIVMRIYDITKAYPERLDNQQLEADLPSNLYEDVRASLEHPSRLEYFHRAKDAFHKRNWGPKTSQLYEGGVQLLVGTDSGTPMNFHYESTWQEMDLLVDYGIPPMKVISMATRYPARLYGKEDELGTIEPGKLADLIVVDGDPLRHMSALEDVVHVIKGGKLYK
jgi:imidazolonepropionase-like amidohydrolase